MSKVDKDDVHEPTFLKVADLLQKEFPHVDNFDLLIPALRYIAQIMEDANVTIKSERVYH